MPCINGTVQWRLKSKGPLAAEHIPTTYNNKYLITKSKQHTSKSAIIYFWKKIKNKNWYYIYSRTRHLSSALYVL